MKKFFKVFFYCTGFTALCIVMQFIAAIPVSAAYIFLKSFQYALSGNPELAMNLDLMTVVNDILMPSYILSAILTFFSAWIIHAVFRRKFFERLSLNRTSPVYTAVSFLAGCAMQMPLSFIITLVEKTGIAPDLFEEYTQHVEQLMSNQNTVLQILAVGIMAPLIEEIIFRGLILNQLKRNIPATAAILIQAILFGFVHLNVVQGTYAFVMAVLMGMLTVWFDSLFVSIAFHMGMNLSGVILSEFGAGLSDAAGVIMLAVSFILIPLCIMFLYFKSAKGNSHTPKVNPTEGAGV
ncbi:abortive infection protein [Thermoclostridium stercorarium subsp. leptospartum DSM 9219]|uniref:Abortive infection protein n=1 Tax=Thermoclostridium stercorarium subsp. leptospartum DSM 9219 TaxID=1346611 RepID=A0A1B1YKX6_THEST|nr:CPBP family intramembrane glutamic endopeptidase [Thermoclostridium stercorarium]ANX01421.1 abortive infection protein [Thermoclostridium stercorarium subsp. leptospartum DSM 9219]